MNYFKSLSGQWTLITCVALFFLTSNIAAQQSKKRASVQKSQQAAPRARFEDGRSALRIPLEIDNNIILMRVSVNHSKPLRFIFDTGASTSAISSQRAAELGLQPQGEARGDATGGRIHGSFTKGVLLAVQGAEVSNQLIISLPFPVVPGFEFDGVIGYDFIKQFVVEIDYLTKTMNLYDPFTYAYSGKGEPVPLQLARRKTPLVRAQIFLEGRTSINAHLEVDTGADNTFVINSPFVRKHKLVEAIQKTTQDTRNGAGGKQKVLMGLFKAAQLGSFIFQSPPAALSLDTEGAGASKDNDGVVGGEIFRRFKLILDYSRRRMILEPNTSFNDPYSVEPDGE